MIKRTVFKRESRNSKHYPFHDFLEIVVYPFLNRKDIKVITIQEKFCDNGDTDIIVWFKDKNADKN